MALLISCDSGNSPLSPGLSYLTCKTGKLMSVLPQVMGGRATRDPEQEQPRVSLVWIGSVLLTASYYKQPEASVAPQVPHLRGERGGVRSGCLILTAHAHSGDRSLTHSRSPECLPADPQSSLLPGHRLTQVLHALPCPHSHRRRLRQRPGARDLLQQLRPPQLLSQPPLPVDAPACLMPTHP